MQCKRCKNNPAIFYAGKQYFYCDACMKVVKKEKRMASHRPITAFYERNRILYIKLHPYFIEERLSYWELNKTSCLGNNIPMWRCICKVPDDAHTINKLIFTVHTGMSAPESFLSFPLNSEECGILFKFISIRNKMKGLGVSFKQSQIGFCKCGTPIGTKRDRITGSISFWPTCFKCKR